MQVIPEPVASVRSKKHRGINEQREGVSDRNFNLLIFNNLRLLAQEGHYFGGSPPTARSLQSLIMNHFFSLQCWNCTSLIFFNLVHWLLRAFGNTNIEASELLWSMRLHMDHLVLLWTFQTPHVVWSNFRLLFSEELELNNAMFKFLTLFLLRT